jgi:hypothetical protein
MPLLRLAERIRRAQCNDVAKGVLFGALFARSLQCWIYELCLIECARMVESALVYCCCRRHDGAASAPVVGYRWWVVTA